MTTPQVSVVIPTYDRAEYVGRAIDSVLAQTYDDYEILVVDDGSTDDTPKVLKAYSDKITCMSQDNRGVSSARNAALHVAAGRWVAFLDSDDTWLPDKLERQVRCVERTGARVCFTGTLLRGDIAALRVEQDTTRAKKAVERVFEDPLELILVEAPGLYVQAMLAEKGVLDSVGGFDESMIVAEDTRLIYDLAFRTTFAFIDAPLVVVDRTGERGGLINGSVERRRALGDAHIAILSDVYARSKDRRGPVRPNLRRRLGHAFSRRAEVACVDGDLGQARHLAANALRYGGSARICLRALAAYISPRLVARRCRRIWAVPQAPKHDQT